MLRVTCSCGKRLTTDEKNAGRRTKCTKCGAEVAFTIPETASVGAVEQEVAFGPVDRAPSEGNVSELVARLETLEASHSRVKAWCRWSLAGAALALVVAGLAVMTPAGRPSTPPPVVVRERSAPTVVREEPLWPGAVEATAFILRDRERKYRGAFWVNAAGETSLEMSDPGETMRASVLVKPDGSASLGLGDVRREKDTPGFRLVTTPDNLQGFMMQGSRRQRYNILMGVDEDPILNVSGLDGRKVP